jgi:hypothetical protein
MVKVKAPSMNRLAGVTGCSRLESDVFGPTTSAPSPRRTSRAPFAPLEVLNITLVVNLPAQSAPS